MIKYDGIHSLVINFGSIVGAILRPMEEWYQKRYPAIVVALQHQGRTAVARIATFGQPIFVRTIKFELLGKDVVDVTLNQMIAPHGQLDCPMPREALSTFVLTDDMAVSATYRTASGREATSEARVFNIVGGEGSIAKVVDFGRDVSVAKCPKCGEGIMFSNGGITTKRQLVEREKAFKKDLRKTCPDHERSRVKFWFDPQ